MQIIPSDHPLHRRSFLHATSKFATTAALLPATLLAQQTTGQEQHEGDDDISTNDRLMREHGILKRVLVIYEEIIRRIDAKEDIAPQTVIDSAGIIGKFMEDYHQKSEEEHVFPLFRNYYGRQDVLRSRANGLFVIDYDPQAIRFVKINRALLAASTDRADYLNLRLNASPELWRQRSQRLVAEDKEALSNPESWTFWDKKVRKNLTAWENAFEHFHSQPKVPSDPFFAADYLFDDRLYSRLSQLAKGSRIWVRQLDLRHESEVRSFCEKLKSRLLTLGVIDPSDVPNASKTGTSVAAQYVKLISQYAPEDAIFLNTAPPGAQGVHWSYFAFSNRKIRGRDQNTIQRWYEIEIKKISSSNQAHSLLDDPDAINH